MFFNDLDLQDMTEFQLNDDGTYRLETKQPIYNSSNEIEGYVDIIYPRLQIKDGKIYILSNNNFEENAYDR